MEMANATDPRSMVTVVLQSTFMALIILAAIVGNSLILLSLYRFTCLKTKTNAFVLNLAIADLLLATLAMPFTLVSSITFDWTLPTVMCQVVAMLNSVFCSASIMTLASVSLERFIAIVYPLKYELLVTPKRVQIGIGCVWLQAFLCPCSTFVFSKFTFLRFESICTVDWGYNVTYTLIFAFVFLFVPFLITSVLYCIILNRALKQRRRIEVIRVGEIMTDASKTTNRENRRRNVDRRTKKEYKATVTIAIVIGTFSVCWFPHAVGIFCLSTPSCQWSDSFYVSTTWLAMLNSAMNSLIYGLMNRNFRNAFKSIIMYKHYAGDSAMLTNFGKETMDNKSYGNLLPID
ncbi:Alpha-1A adrenergic receptor [Acropora cervicornis]|uniref:Alpha-1A adrenergic receptor n=1 Tax=Acropora cervicornis TaxID=6130 RepID=A0AAD9VE96_ACRCE|nr:Alpha-1A adrenergic receptor [Acropora cervicornis]